MSDAPNDGEPDRLIFQFDLMALKEKYNLPDGWEIYAWELKNHKTPPTEYVLFSGAVVTETFKSGPRKGKKNWAKKNRFSEMDLPMTHKEMDAFKAKWSKDTGLCAKCHGNGTAWMGWSAVEGHRYKPCGACHSSGRVTELEATK